MSEPPPSESQLEETASMSGEQDGKTELSHDIVNALRQLQAGGGAPQYSPTPTPTQGNGEESAAMKQDHTPPPQSEWDRLRAQLRERPVDADGWLSLVDLAEESGDIEKIKQTYEGMLEVYPNTPSVQIAYLKHFLDDPSQFGQAEALFRRFLLRTTPSVELLKFYLTYIRRVTTGPNAREVIRKCYDFALGHVGQDKDSYEIWQDYINFLKAGETNTTWEEQQKMDAVRKAYQHAVQIPMENVKRLWEEYQDFENGLNRITAKKFISDLTEAHMQARTVLNQLQEHLTVLFPPPPPPKNNRPAIWLPRPPTFNPNDRALVQRWRLYLKWEESNPLEIEEKDRTTFLQRVQSVYRKAVVRMRYYSEIWYMAYAWTNSIGKTDEAIALLKSGIEANPASFVLNFAYAEALELQGNFAEVHATYEKFLEVLRKDLEATEERINSANSSNSSIGSQNSQKTESNAMDITPNQSQLQLQATSPNSSFATQAADEKPPKNKELLDKRTDYGIVYIMYMRFGRRAEGLKSARNIFGKARRDRWTPWEVYEAAALMEYHCGNKDVQVASRIFEKGMETFGDEVEFVLRYLGFLISINDENNARALFERVIGTFSPEKARPLWERWARYEYQYGDLAAAQKLEKRMAEVYPSDPPIKRFAERHKYLNIDAIAVRDLGFVLGRQSARSSGMLGRADTIQSLMASQAKETPPAPSSSKRQSSPETRRRDDSRTEYPSKRPRPASPVPARERDREWRDGRDGREGSRRRHGSPMWEREREREAPPRRNFKEDREEDKGVALPGVLSWFIGTLPSSNSFDGPVFRTDDLMQVFRNAVIPSSTAARARSPPSASRPGGRPPPDYGPYQGPGGGRRGRW
ncbi:Suf-domain-containing protein [Trametes coccinea BRFM310]|uniref:mRNA 3'-end-processing protein RNA14 n=1 Tax=Trametes coccinea (strain BRFM310) TaxID=1353009 RepID=A0A1Y2ILC1_TRAC3|nr:Suf-domain-containing protein [Trametes coccinea BRFM310]